MNVGQKKEKRLFGTQATLISDVGILPVLEHVCSTANNLINSAVYDHRQDFINERKFYAKHDVRDKLKDTNNFQFLHSQCAQGLFDTVREMFESFKALKYGKQTQ